LRSPRTLGFVNLLSLAPEGLPTKNGHVCSWPKASVRCVAAIRPGSEVEPTCRGRRSIGANGP